jgi:endonuclease/exonuclease/phosphatase (EEP) superfamily protein YafD
LILRGEFKGAVTGLALVAAVLLVAVSVDVGIPGQPQLQTLRFHLAGAMVLAVIALFILGGWRRALLFTLIALASLGQGGYGLLRMQLDRYDASQVPAGESFEMLSLNVFNDNPKGGAAIADLIANSSAAVVAIMEARPLLPHLAALSATYPARVGCDSDKVCDLTLLSRTPLTDVQVRSLGRFSYNRLITAVTEIAGHRVTIVVAHMVKPYFDYASVEESHIIARVLRDIQGPMLLTGDFNAAPWSDNIKWMIRATGLLTGPVYPATWPVELGPFGVPIDNMFTRGGLLIEDIHSIPLLGSNHRGLAAKLAFRISN